jgi:hypothetical protein
MRMQTAVRFSQNLAAFTWKVEKENGNLVTE